MIIYGYRNREIERGTGNFYCSSCEVQRPYRHKKIVRYFTLFFIPLFPLGTLSEYVECQVCGHTYKPEVLSAASTTSAPILETDRYISSIQGSSQNFENTRKAGLISSYLPITLVIGGILSILGGFAMGIAMIAVQSQGSTGADVISLLLAMICCPAPLLLLGALAIGAAIFLLRQKDQFSQT